MLEMPGTRAFTTLVLPGWYFVHISPTRQASYAGNTY